jgi:1-acyl-sn-glycerol-3-phosphate acyltransferase
MYRLFLVIGRALIFLITRRRISGQEHTPTSGALLIVSNHLGNLDPIITGTKLPRRLYILAKVELFSWPLIGWLARLADVIPIRRGQSDRDALRRVLEHLHAGHAVLLYPEGTYPKGNTPIGLIRAQPGAAMLALRSGATILPIGISGSEYVWTRRGLPWNLFRRWPVEVHVGEPYRPTVPPGASQKQALALVGEEMMRRIAALLPEAYRGYYREQATPAGDASVVPAQSSS